MSRKSYLPPLAFDRLTPFYDCVLSGILRERQWKDAFVRQVAPMAGERILDLGCGTGTLTIQMKKAAPEAEVLGLDPDSAALERACGKAAEAGAAVLFHEGIADKPPATPEFGEGSFDKVTSSLMLHHLSHEVKRRTFLRVRALLRSGGTFHVVDWGPAATTFHRVVFLGTRLLDGFEPTRDNVSGRLPAMIGAAGFDDVEETRHQNTIAGTLRFYKAVRRGDCVLSSSK